MLNFLRLFETYGAMALEKQLALGDLLGDHNWWLDLQAGTIRFGERLTCRVQVLGTESHSDQSWLWAWANTQSPIPEPLLAASRSLAELGEQEEIDQLRQALLKLEGFDGHHLAMLGSGYCGADAYYRCPYEGGAAFVLLEAPELRARLDHSPERMIRAYTLLLSMLPVSHQRTLVLYCEQCGYEYAATAARIEARNAAGQQIVAEFDTAARLSQIETTLPGGAQERGGLEGLPPL